MTTARTIDLVLIPAAPTAWDAERRLAGSADIPPLPSALPALEAQLAGLSVQPARVVCGPEEACRTVAKGLGQRLKKTPKGYAELREIGLGLWEGMLRTEAEQRYASAYGLWVEDPSLVLPPEGEALGEAKTRLMTLIAGIASRLKSGQGLAVVVRPMALEVIHATVENRPITDLASAVENLSVRRLSVAGDTLRAFRPAVVRTFLM